MTALDAELAATRETVHALEARYKELEATENAASSAREARLKELEAARTASSSVREDAGVEEARGGWGSTWGRRGGPSQSHRSLKFGSTNADTSYSSPARIDPPKSNDNHVDQDEGASESKEQELLPARASLHDDTRGDNAKCGPRDKSVSQVDDGN